MIDDRISQALIFLGLTLNLFLFREIYHETFARTTFGRATLNQANFIKNYAQPFGMPEFQLLSVVLLPFFRC